MGSDARFPLASSLLFLCARYTLLYTHLGITVPNSQC